jgi:hypothetical protein
MAFQTLTVRLEGVSPLLMHNGQMIDQRNEYARAMKAISGKRMKTDADHEEMARIEWTASLYVRDGKIVLPSEVIEAALVNAARKTKNGKQAQAGLFVDGDAPLVFADAGKEITALWSAGRYTFGAPVRVGAARVIRTRPRFDEWSAEVKVVFDDGLFNRAQVIDLIRTCGEIVGVGDWRPKFGRFSVAVS